MRQFKLGLPVAIGVGDGLGIPVHGLREKLPEERCILLLGRLRALACGLVERTLQGCRRHGHCRLELHCGVKCHFFDHKDFRLDSHAERTVHCPRVDGGGSQDGTGDGKEREQSDERRSGQSPPLSSEAKSGSPRGECQG